jgi:hypothetical protein
MDITAEYMEHPKIPTILLLVATWDRPLPASMVELETR